MEMPDVIYATPYNEECGNGEWDITRWTKCPYVPNDKKPDGETKYHHDRIVEALKAENVTLMAIIDQLQNRIGHWQVAHSEMVTEVDLRVRIAELEAILEARGV